MNSAGDFLLWVKGPGFDLALTIFVLGILIRLFEILLLGRRPNYAKAKGDEFSAGIRTLFTRTLPEPGTLARSPFTIIGGYIWHIGFLIVLFLFIPHIELFDAVFGLRWPGLPNHLVDGATVITLVGLLAMLFDRLAHPVKRFLSGAEDYLVWLLTFLPLLTGYIAYHRLIDPYQLALGLHILSAELLMVVFPFTKLMHAITFIAARWYNGAAAGRRGVQS
jgi:nitrate reductase gamma subunit